MRCSSRKLIKEALEMIRLSSFLCTRLCPLACRTLHSHIPVEPTWNTTQSKPPTRAKVSKSKIELLERLALVDFGNEEGVKRLEAAIDFADELQAVDITSIEPMYSVLEDSQVHLREDKVTEGYCQQEITSNAKVTEEGYFVSPPGNIPLKKEEKEYIGELNS